MLRKAANWSSLFYIYTLGFQMGTGLNCASAQSCTNINFHDGTKLHRGSNLHD